MINFLKIMVALHARDVLYSMPCIALSQIGAGPFAAEAAPRRTHVERALYASPKVGGGGGDIFVERAR